MNMGTIPADEPRTIKVDPADLDAFRSLVQSITEATAKLLEALQEAQALTTHLQGQQTPTEPPLRAQDVTVAPCTNREPHSDHLHYPEEPWKGGTRPASAPAWCEGVEAADTETHREFVTGDLAFTTPTMPNPADTGAPVARNAGGVVLCPECRQGKRQNCTQALEGGDLCRTWSAYRSGPEGRGETFQEFLNRTGGTHA